MATGCELSAMSRIVTDENTCRKDYSCKNKIFRSLLFYEPTKLLADWAVYQLCNACNLHWPQYFNADDAPCRVVICQEPILDNLACSYGLGVMQRDVYRLNHAINTGTNQHFKAVLSFLRHGYFRKTVTTKISRGSSQSAMTTSVCRFDVLSSKRLLSGYPFTGRHLPERIVRSTCCSVNALCRIRCRPCFWYRMNFSRWFIQRRLASPYSSASILDYTRPKGLVSTCLFRKVDNSPPRPGNADSGFASRTLAIEAE